MIKKTKLLSIVFTLLMICLIQRSFGQGIGIGTTDVEDDAVLQIDAESTGGGLIIPRMTTDDREDDWAISDGVLVYDTDKEAFYYYDEDNTSWVRLVASRANDDTNANSKRITDVADGTNDGDAVNFGQINDVDNDNLNRDGTETMTGNLNAGSNRIINLSDGVDDADAVTMGQVNPLSDALLDLPTVLTISENSTDLTIDYERVRFLQVGSLGIIIGEIEFTLADDFNSVHFTIEDDIPGFSSPFLGSLQNQIFSFAHTITPADVVELSTVEGNRPIVFDIITGSTSVGDPRLSFSRELADESFDIGQWTVKFQITYFAGL